MDQRRFLGNWGEDIAVQYLKGKGYQIVERNYKNYFGEIDIIARHKKKYVFVEVKSRYGEKNNRPEEAVNYIKAGKLRRAAEKYILEKQIKNDYQIDVIAIVKDKRSDQVYLTHFKEAVRYF